MFLIHGTYPDLKQLLSQEDAWNENKNLEKYCMVVQERGSIEERRSGFYQTLKCHKFVCIMDSRNRFLNLNKEVMRI